MNLSNEKLLRAARTLFGMYGTIPLDVAADLMDAGFIVEELEERWDAEKENG